jgi:flagellar capping protein FliD
MALTANTIAGVNETYRQFFRQIIDAALTTQSKPLDQLASQRTTLNALVQAYTRLNSKLTDLTSAIADLRSSAGSVWTANKVSVGGHSVAGGTIVTASATRSAVAGAYTISVTSLARAQRAASDAQVSATAALGLEGTFVIGGTGARAVSDASPVLNTVSAFGTAAVRSGQTELSHGSYHVEIRDHHNTLQFRIVDEHGVAVSVDVAGDAGTAMTSDWQDLSTVAGTTFDTGRGLTITFAPLSDHAVADVVTMPDTVEAITTSAVRSGQAELASGRYYVETRENGAGSGEWQFRLVDATGTAVSIYDAAAADGSFTAGWQAIDAVLANDANGVFVTGRGISIDFGEGPYVEGTMGAGAAQVDYTARLTQVGTIGAGAASVSYTSGGALITVSSGDSLIDIANAINTASYPDGAGVSASIVTNRLVLTAKSTGAAHTIQLADVQGTVLSGTGANGIGLISAPNTFKNTGPGSGYQDATDAVFTVNGITVTRDRNTGLSDVVTGMTINLAADAEGQSAILTVERDTGSIADKISTLLDAFTAFQSLIKNETGVTASGSGANATYTRNALAGDNTLFTTLRTSLYMTLSETISGLPAGAPTSLRQIGITLDANLVPVLDANALDAALAADPSGVEALLNAVLDNMEKRLSPYTGADGMINRKIAVTNEQLRGVNDRVSQIQERIESQRAVLEKQYSHLLVQLTQMTYSQQQMRMYWGGTYG